MIIGLRLSHAEKEDFLFFLFSVDKLYNNVIIYMPKEERRMAMVEIRTCPTAREYLIYIYCIQADMDWDKTYRIIRDKEDPDKNGFELISAVADYERKHRCVTLLDDDYPDGLKAVFKPKFVLVD